MAYNAKDIYLERAKTNQTFEEFPLVVQPNAVVITDSGSNLRTTPIASLLSGISDGNISASILTVVSQSFLDNGRINTDGNGNLNINGNGSVSLVVGGITYLDNGQINTSGDGNLNVNGELNAGRITGSLLGTASNATTIDVDPDVIIHSHQGSIYALATSNVILSATAALSMEALSGDISMYPSSTVNVYGNLNVSGVITASLGGTASYAVSASWAPGGGSFNGTASYFDNGNGSTINASGFANLGVIIVNDPSIPVVALLSGHGFYQDEVHGRVGFNGRYDDTQPNSYFESSRVEGRKDANSPNYGGALVFMTADSSGSMQERIKIDKTGNADFKGTLSINGTPGLTTTQDFKDGSGTTRTMTITNGLITAIV